jgi:hypothetical protein
MENERNVDEVINALARAKENVPKDWEYLARDESIAFEVMEYDYKCKELGDQIGVSIDQFPPAEQLEEDEIKLIVDQMISAMQAYNYHADLPEGLPVRIAYKTLLGVWNEVVPLCPFGSFHFDFYDEDFDQYLKK